MTVFDKAGNSVKKELTFEVGYLLEPTLALYGDAPEEGRTQRINVTATPNSDVSIVTMHSGEVLMTEKVRTNSTGGAIFVSSVALSLGEYKVWATAHDDRGAVSRRSNEVLFTPDPSFFGMISRNPGVPIAMLAVLLLFFFLRRVLSGLREELNAEAIMLGQQEGQGAVVRVGKPEQATFDVLASPVEQVILRKKE